MDNVICFFNRCKGVKCPHRQLINEVYFCWNYTCEACPNLSMLDDMEKPDPKDVHLKGDGDEEK
jgi:hypothetical protein